jgi:hypothetical protein
MSISPVGAQVVPNGQPRAGSSAGDFEMWSCGPLGVECLSPWELCEGNLEGTPLLGTLREPGQ